MTDTVVESTGYAHLLASANICPAPAALAGIFVSAASATPTITVYDDVANGTGKTMVGTFTPVAGTYYQLPGQAVNGLNVVLGGTIECTAFFCPQTTLGNGA